MRYVNTYGIIKKRLGHLLLLCISIFFPREILGQFIPKKDGDFRIAVLACIRQFEPVPAFASYVESNPDLCLWIGDNIYADAENDPAWIQTCYDSLAAKPHFQALRQDFDFMATWDDHDFGFNNAGKEYHLKKESKAIFRKFWGLENTIPNSQDGIYYARKFKLGEKTLQIIMLDTRYNRDSPGTNSDVLGINQWQWLEQELREESDLILIVSGFQILLDRHSGSETWDKFPKAKQRLFNTIREAKAENVLFLTGDQHYGEVCRLRNTLDFDAVELQFAGLNQIEDPEFNPHRVSPAIRSKHSIAIIDIQMETSKEDIPHLLFQIANSETGQIEVTYRVNLNEIALGIDFSGPTQFANSSQVTLNHPYPNLNLHYTLDGSEPTESSPLYSRPISLASTTTVKARLYMKDNKTRSKVFTRYYEKLIPISPKIHKKRNLLKKGLLYEYFEGNFATLPDFNLLKPVKKGKTSQINLKEIPHRDDHFAVRYTGFITLQETGVYQFHLTSDDGSKLYVANRLVVDNDGSHSVRRKTGLIALEKGTHPIKIEYFDDYQGQSLSAGDRKSVV